MNIVSKSWEEDPQVVQRDLVPHIKTEVIESVIKSMKDEGLAFQESDFEIVDILCSGVKIQGVHPRGCGCRDDCDARTLRIRHTESRFITDRSKEVPDHLQSPSGYLDATGVTHSNFETLPQEKLFDGDNDKKFYFANCCRR